MKKYLLTTVAALGALTTLSMTADAADIIEPPVYIEPVPIVHPKPVSTAGWYLRGDVGYVFSDTTRGRYKAHKTNGLIHKSYFETYSYDEIELKDSFLVSGGVGYRFNEFARMDFTADYFESDLRGTSNCAPFDLPSSECRFDDKSSSDIWVLMANAYADLGTYAGITPYLGGGLGFAHVKYGTLNNKYDCGGEVAKLASRFPNSTAGQLCGKTFKHDGKSDWRFAYGLSVGASYDITHNLKFDAGYKWTHINGGDAFGFDKFDKAAGAKGTQGFDDGFDIHTVRAGLRYEFGGGGFGGFGKGKGKGPAPIYAEPAPIYDEVVYK